MPLPTAPSSLAVTAQAATSISLSWTAATGHDHYDIYRAPARSSGFYGPFAKINSGSVSSGATSYVDSSVLSTTAPSSNHQYCYQVYAIAPDSSQVASEPVFACSFDGTNATELIYDAILSRVASVLALDSSSWAEIDWVVQRDKNSAIQRDYRYGLLVGDGEPVAGPISSYDTLKTFRLVLVRQVSKADQNDDDLKDKIKGGLSDLLEKCYIDLLRSRLALPTVVVMVERPRTASPEFLLEENAIEMAAEIGVRYRIALS